MATKRPTADDYRRELHSLKLQELSVEKHVRRRFLDLCKKNPDVALYQQVDATNKNVPVLAGWFCDDINIRVAILDTNAQLRYIEVIEKYLASIHPHKQTKIEF